MTASFTLPRDRIVDANGVPVSGARVRFFNAGTTTPKNVYSDQATTTPISQPVTADGGGLLPMIYYGTGLYKVRISDASDVLIYETDNVDPGLGAVAAALPVSAGGTGATTKEAARAELEVPSQDELDDIALEFSELESSVTAALAAAALAVGTPTPLGLTITVTSNTAVQLTAAEVVLADSTGTNRRRLSSVSVSADITASGANGLDTGTESVSQWYFVYVIWNPTTTTTAALLSTVSSNPVLPSGYTYARRCGAIRNDASSNFFRTIQYGTQVAYVFGTNPSTNLGIVTGSSGGSNVSYADYIPPTASTILGIISGTVGPSTTDVIRVGPVTGIDAAKIGPQTTSSALTMGVPFSITTSNQIMRYAAQGTSARADVLGWIDQI